MYRVWHGGGKTKGRKLEKKNLSPYMSVKGFGHCHWDSPARGQCGLKEV